MVYDSGKKVYELVDPDGNAYVLQARASSVSMDDLDNLGEKMKSLPQGWTYRARRLDDQLILDADSTKETISAVTDEFEQYYTLPPQQ
jgi:hypothetical protein